MRKLIGLLLLAGMAWAQAPSVRIDENPSKAKFYNGSDKLEYVCSAKPSAARALTWSIDASTLTSIVDASDTATVNTVAAHGIQKGDNITISGETGDTDLNGPYEVQTTPTATSFTITTVDVTDATYNASGLQVDTTNPVIPLTDAVWAIERRVLDASGNEIRVIWADGNENLDNICASRTSLAYR